MTPSPTPTPVATSTPASSPSATPFVADRTYTSDDGQLTMLVPEGAIPDDVTLNAFARGQGDLPLELVGLEVRSAFYEIRPDGLVFASPVRMERQMRVRDLVEDLAAEGLPLLVMAMRSSNAEWDWLDAQQLALADRSVMVTGDAQHSSLLFAFGGRDFTTFQWSEPSLIVRVGSTFGLTVALTFPEEATDPPLLGELSPVAAAGIVESVSTVASDGSTATQTFRCVAAGEAPIGVTYPVSNINAESVLFGQLGLGPASTQVTVTQTVTCSDDATAPPTPSPGDSPAASPPSL